MSGTTNPSPEPTRVPDKPSTLKIAQPDFVHGDGVLARPEAVLREKIADIIEGHYMGLADGLTYTATELAKKSVTYKKLLSLFEATMLEIIGEDKPIESPSYPTDHDIYVMDQNELREAEAYRRGQVDELEHLAGVYVINNKTFDWIRDRLAELSQQPNKEESEL